MIRIRIALLALGVGLLAGADEPKRDAGDDRDRLQGSWTMVSVVIDGMAVPGEYARTGRLEVAGDRYAVTLGVTIASTFRLDSTKTPRQADFTFTDGPQKGQTVRGIYEIDGATYRLCRGLRPEVERPGQFDCPADSGRMLVVWKRAQQAGGDKEAAIREELARFEGSWQFDSMEAEGKAVPLESFKGIRLVLKGDRFTMTEPVATYGGTYTVDPIARPKTIDVTFTEGPEKGKTSYGIYELDGDTYKVCIGLVGKPRPTEFASKPGSGHVLEVLKREKP
jgi:uncharacterized protein (TIGR03067 family)